MTSRTVNTRKDWFILHQNLQFYVPTERLVVWSARRTGDQLFEVSLGVALSAANTTLNVWIVFHLIGRPSGLWLCTLVTSSWRWRHYVPPIRCFLSTRLHRVISQKTAICIFSTGKISDFHETVVLSSGDRWSPRSAPQLSCTPHALWFLINCPSDLLMCFCITDMWAVTP